MMLISLLQIQMPDCRKDQGVGSDACCAFVASPLAFLGEGTFIKGSKLRAIENLEPLHFLVKILIFKKI